MSPQMPQDGTNSAPRMSPDGQNALRATERLILTALDWSDYTCQSDPACTHTARFEVHLHAVDLCNSEHTNPDGNVIALMCTWHATLAQSQTAEWLAWYRRCGTAGILSCRSCGSPMREVEDVVREIRTLT